VAVDESKGSFGGFTGYGNVGGSRFDQMETFGSTYSTPGWQRAKGRGAGFAASGAGGTPGGYGKPQGLREVSRLGAPTGARERGAKSGPATIEGELVAKSTGTISAFAVGDRVFHQKFGNGNVLYVEGNKLTIAFDRAGEKKVVDLFVEKV